MARQDQQIINQQILNLDNPTSSTLDQEVEYTPLRILRTINECPTRWGSALASWKRLYELKDPIKRVILNLSLEIDNKEAKKDYKELRDRNLKSWEWDLLNQLIKLFKPIEDATEWLGGQKYCTLSLIYPTIQTLKYDYITIENIDNEGKFINLY